MDNKKDPNELIQGWMDEILKKLDIPEFNGLGADEQAAASAGLTHPDDMELERIVQETLAENWQEEADPNLNPEEDKENSTRFFPHQHTEDAPTPETDEDMAESEDETEPMMDEKQSKKKKGVRFWGIPQLLGTIIWLCVIVAVGIPLGRTLWAGAADLLALGKSPQMVTITLEEGDSISDIAQKLQKAGMIEYPGLFEAFAKFTNKGNNTLVGSITFDEKMVYDYNALINALSYRGTSRVTVDVMIPEGYNCAQIFELLEKKKVCTVAELEEYAANGELGKFWFLDGVERGHKYCLEGFLFPDTYEFYIDDEPGRVFNKFLSDFDYRFTDRLLDKFVALNNKTGLNLTIRQLVTMASIVEKEKANDLEGYTIASVFYNRLTNPAKYPFLNSDATLLYDENFYSKGQLVTSEQKKASPYNTYSHKGLPVGPIANPGLSSLDAALDPEDTSYFYFIYDKEAGVSRFSKNLVEHSAWAEKLGLS